MTDKLKLNLIKAAVILAAGFMDFSINYLFNIVLKIPLFLDTTFMIAVLFIFGPAESFMAYLVNMLRTALRLYVLYGSTEYIYLYSLSAITIIVITWAFIKYTRKKSAQPFSVNRMFILFLMAAIAAAFACSLVSGIISYFTYQQNADEWAFDKIIFSVSLNGRGGLLLTSIIGRIPLTVLDRIITTFAGFGVYKVWRILFNKNKLSGISICTFLFWFLLIGCSNSGGKHYNRITQTYDLWTELHESKSVAAAETFFEIIDEYDFEIFRFYPEMDKKASDDRILMNQYKLTLLDLLEAYEQSPDMELEIVINDVVNQIDRLMINYIQRRNYIVEETQQRYTSFYIILIFIIVVIIIFLLVLNERELKKKDNRIFQSESVLKHTMEVQEAERSRISRDLHDTVAQSMRYVSILAEKIADKELANTIISVQNSNIEDIRKMCYNLTPPNFKNMDVSETLNILADKVFDRNETQIRIVVNGFIDFSVYNDEQFLNVYRIIQELFQNIKKHAHASEVTVLFRKEEKLKIIVTDDGTGIDSKLLKDINARNDRFYQNLHFGIKNVLERVQLLNGTIEFRSIEELGTTVIMEF